MKLDLRPVEWDCECVIKKKNWMGQGERRRNCGRATDRFSGRTEIELKFYLVCLKKKIGDYLTESIIVDELVPPSLELVTR